MKKFNKPFLAIIGGILLWAAWPVSPFTFLIFIGWVPMLLLEDRISNWKKFFALTYLHMMIWNILTTWWIWNSSEVGAISAILANSLIMCLPWLLMYFTKRKMGNWVGYGSLIIFWLSFEYLHHNWDLSWPWLTLGNSMAMRPEWIQWYEYSGTTGGSLWILLSNIVAFTIIKEYMSNGRTIKYFATMLGWVVLLLMPILISKILSNTSKKQVEQSQLKAVKNVVIVQPNIDPYIEKFEAGTQEAQIRKLITLSELQIDSNTALVVWPETAISVGVWEDQIKDNYFFYPVWSFLQRHPQMSLLTGINCYRNYGVDKKNATKTARFDEQSGIYYDAFNTAAMFDADTTIQLYHKAKLVPGVESLPSFLNWMGPWFENFGGISGTLGSDKQRKVFTDKQKHFKAAPVICYESIYSDYITEFIRNGANILTIVTNDGWWGNTAGYKQHMNYARLRAVETRKWVVRSANTGISCFIDPLGNVIYPQPWDIASSIKLNVPVNDQLTFFVKHGDALSRAMVLVSLLLIVINIGIWVRKYFSK